MKCSFFQAEATTDEVYAQVSLFPENEVGDLYILTFFSFSILRFFLCIFIYVCLNPFISFYFSFYFSIICWFLLGIACSGSWKEVPRRTNWGRWRRGDWFFEQVHSTSYVLQDPHSLRYQHPWWVLCSATCSRRLFPSSGNDYLQLPWKLVVGLYIGNSV